MQVNSLNVSAQRQPGESQFTCATQLRASSTPNVSEYQVDPA
jgi:hypothetical protein